MTAALFLALSPVPATLPASPVPAVMAMTLPGALAMATGDIVEPPHGYVAMCATDNALCSALAAANPGPVEEDPDAQRVLLEKVNHLVNATVHQASDEDTVGEVDKWRRTGLDRDARGDCEDLAIEKRLALINAGFPAANLYFAVGYKPNIGLHAVLVAHTDRGEIVLDSRTAALASWQRAPYMWVSRQTPGAPDLWTDPWNGASPQKFVLSRSGTTAALDD